MRIPLASNRWATVVQTSSLFCGLLLEPVDGAAVTQKQLKIAITANIINRIGDDIFDEADDGTLLS